MNNETILEVRAISKSFNGRKVVDNMSFRVMRGDVYGFLGRNGQGKTTTIRLMTGLIFPDAGEVFIGGHSIKTNFKQAISHVGAIVETPAFYSYLSGYENLLLMANLIPNTGKEKVNEVLEISGLKNRARDKVKTYSLGMKQRLGIANALLGEPELIILDEPTNGLDPQGMREIKELISQLSSEKNIAFFISSHLIHDVEQICNRVAMVSNGKLLVENSVKSLLCESGGKSLEDIYFEITGTGA